MPCCTPCTRLTYSAVVRVTVWTVAVDVKDGLTGPWGHLPADGLVAVSAVGNNGR